MASMSMALPVKSGKTDRLRGFCREVVGERLREFAASEERLGLTREAWYLHPTPMGDLAIVWVEGDDPIKALVTFVQSQDRFDRWFKAEILDITGVDLNTPPAQVPERLYDWTAAVGVR